MAKSKKKSGQHQAPVPSTAKLELPDGYKLKSKSKKKPKKKGKTDSKPADQSEDMVGKTIKAIQKATRDAELAEAGLPPAKDKQLAPVQKRLQKVLESRAGELGLDTNPTSNTPQLVFIEPRQWRSLTDSTKFLREYAGFQARKYDPGVFVEEIHTRGHCQEDLEAEYVEWYKNCRLQYYKRHGLLGKLKVLEKTKNWPNTPSMTSAPFLRSTTAEYRFRENKRNSKLPVFSKLLSVPDVACGILTEVALEGFINLANFSKTCHAAFTTVGRYVELWDTTPPGDYLGEEIYSHDLDSIQRTSAALMIAPVRRPISPTDKKRPDFGYADQYTSETKLYRALNNRADYVTNLQLHRLQFLDLNAVQCILTSTKGLKLLGIFQCPLLHLGNMSQLLGLIRDFGHRKTSRSTYVDLDFFPMFHQGPNSLMRHGSYGAVWHHPDSDMAAGIWQMVLYELYPTAKRLGIDILRWGSAFRLFMEKLPMRDWAIVKIYEALKCLEFSRVKPCNFSMASYRKSERKWQRFADDVTAALRGDNTEPCVVPGDHLTEIVGGLHDPCRRKYGWWRETPYCDWCEKQVLAVFFPFGEFHCWGCMAKRQLKGQWDHHRTFKAEAASAWFGRWKDLNGCARAGAAGRGWLVARKMDTFRGLEMQHSHGKDDPDWADHSDYPNLHRRYARYYEEHGPIDRKLDDKQYMPVGKYDSPISSRLLNPAFFKVFTIEKRMKAWEDRGNHRPRLTLGPGAETGPKTNEQLENERRRQEKYDTKRERVQQKVTGKVEMELGALVKKQNETDASTIEEYRQAYLRRQMPPNHQVKCWDELVQEMFINSNFTDKNGKVMLYVPELLLRRRPFLLMADGSIPKIKPPEPIVW